MKLHSRAWTSTEQTHDELERQARQYLELRGWLVVSTHDDRHPPAEPGVTDHIAGRPGVLLLLEYKTGRDKLRPSQIEFADRAIRCNIPVHEVRALDELIAIVDRIEEDR